MIQLKLEFQLEKQELPRDLDRLMVSFLKASLQNYSEELFNEMYDKSKSIIKPYTYAYYLPGAKFSTDRINLNENRFNMFFSDADMGQFIHFFNAFKLMKKKKYPMDKNSMKLMSVQSMERNPIKDNEAVIKMTSSLIVRKHLKDGNKDTYFTFDQEGFSDALRENITIFLEKLNIPMSAQGFSIVPVKGKKVVADVFGRKVDANIGVYKITGDVQLLNLLYQVGLGVRRSQGHGKFEIIC